MWYLDIQNEIYTKVKKRAMESLVEKYPNINFTRSTNTQIKAKFPTVYISFLASAEKSKDLEADRINGIQVNAQISVTVSSSQGQLVLHEVMSEVIEQFKKMSFDAYSTPIEVVTSTEIRQMSAYVRRNVDYGDEIL